MDYAHKDSIMRENMNKFFSQLTETLRNQANGDDQLLYEYAFILYCSSENKQFVKSSTNERYNVSMRELGGYCYDVIVGEDNKDPYGYLEFYNSKMIPLENLENLEKIKITDLIATVEDAIRQCGFRIESWNVEP